MIKTVEAIVLTFTGILADIRGTEFLNTFQSFWPIFHSKENEIFV